MYARTLKRALTTGVASTVIASGLVLGASPAPAAEPEPPAPAAALGLLGLDSLLDAKTADPVLLGTGAVGEPLTVVEPVFGLLDTLLQTLVVTDVTWLCDGQAIPGVGDVLQFVPTEAQAGCQVAARTVSSLLGLVPLSLVTNVVPIARADGGGGDDLPANLLGVLTQNPVLQGSGAVGSPLSVTEPVFGLLTPALQALVQTDVTWLCNGEAIPGAGAALQFVPTEAQAGCQVAAQTVSTLLGLLPLSLVTDLIPIPGGQAGAPKALTPASLAGTAKVEQVLTVTDPVWDTTGVTNTYTWLRNGVPISGATAKTYRTTAQDAGKQVAARVTGTKAGASGTSVTNALTIGTDAVERLTASVAPSITGNGRIGGLLQIDPGTWLGGLGGVVAPLFSYQWYNTSGPIPGATGRQYVPRLADAGRPVAAVVTSSLAGFLGGMDVTNVARIDKAGSRTRLAKAGRMLRVVVAPRSIRPTGKVRIRDRGRAVRTIRLRAADNGSRIVRLPRLRTGTHRLTAVYVGNQALERSRSKAVRIRVR